MTLRWRISHSRTTSPSRCAAAPLEPGLAELWSLGGNASVHLLLRVLQHKYATYLPHTAGRYQTKRFRKATVRSTLCVVAGGGGTNCTGAAHWRCLLDLRCCRGVSDMGADVVLIQRPSSGEPQVGEIGNESIYKRNKRVVELDLKDEKR